MMVIGAPLTDEFLESVLFLFAAESIWLLVPFPTEKLELDSDIKEDELLLLNCFSEYTEP